jgi:hypothetical protein
MRSVETIPACGRGIKERGRGANSSLIYLMHFKNSCKCHNVPQASIIKGEKRHLRGKFIAINIYIKEEESSQRSNLSLYLRELGKEEQIKSQNK